MRVQAAALASVLSLLLGTPAAGDATVALNFQDVELPVLARFVSEVTGRNFIIDDRVKGTVTIVSPTRITPEEAYLVFESVLQVKGYTTVPSGSFTKILPAREAREVPTARHARDALVTRILALRHTTAAAVVPVLQPLVSKDGILTAFPPTNRLVVVDTGANVERLLALLDDLDAPSTERTSATLALRHATAEDLAERLQTMLGTTDGDGVRVVAEPRTNSLLLDGSPEAVERAHTLATRLDVEVAPSPATLHVVHLRYAQADALVRVLSHLLGLPAPPAPDPPARGSSVMRSTRRHGGGPPFGDGNADVADDPATAAEPVSAGADGAVALVGPVRVTADPATNALIVSAVPEDWQTLQDVVAELDVRRRQVFVETIILEVTAEKARALGIEFRGGTMGGEALGLGQVSLGALGSAAANPTSLPGLLLAAASNDTVRLPDGSEVPAYTALLSALETETDMDILSAPTVVTTDNEEAEIIVGRNVPFVASRATNATNLSNLFTTIERHDVGITLRMTPRITADEFVQLTVFEEVSDIDRQLSDGALVGDPALVGPTTTIRSASTVVGARHGQTVVIGGLLSDTIRRDERAVPFLSDIPVLGALFRRNEDRRVKTNLLVFLTPHVIDSDQQMARMSQSERDRLLPHRPRRPQLDTRSWQQNAR